MIGRDVSWRRGVAAIEESERLRRDARTAMASSEWETASRLLREAINLDPMSINFDLLGECLHRLGRLEEAVCFLAAGTGLGHNQFKTRVKLAMALRALGESFKHDALWQLEEALRVDPRYGLARKLLKDWISEDATLAEHLGPATLALLEGAQSNKAPQANGS